MKNSEFLQKAADLLKLARGAPLSLEHREKMAIDLAAYMLNEARRIQTPREKKLQTQLARMMKDPKGDWSMLGVSAHVYRCKLGNSQQYKGHLYRYIYS